MSNKAFNKICVICGAKAIGFNFNAITCESCKAFFRRNSLEYQKFKCYLDEECEINIDNRKCCKKCRLKKCFAQGMKTDLILTEEQKKLRRIRIVENKNKIREIIDEITKDVDLTKPDPNYDLNSITCHTTESTNSSDSGHSMELIKYDPNHTMTNSIPDSIYRMAVEIEFSLLPIARPITDCSNKFNELEIKRLVELQKAIQFIRIPEAKTKLVTQDYWQIMFALNTKYDYDIRKIIKMSKCLSAFKNLCADDQIVLLKYASIEIIGLRMMFNLDYETRFWDLISNSEYSTLIHVKIFKRDNDDFYTRHSNFVTQMKQECDSDSFVIDLLTIIILFDPNRPKLKHTEPIKLQQCIYIYLLQRYLQFRYRSECEAKTKLLRFLNSLTELHILNDKIAMNWLNREPEFALPLVKEIVNRDNLVIKLRKDHLAKD